MRVLLLEDDDVLREAIEELLQERGHHVCSAANGEDALDTAGTPDFDLLILDIKLPGIDGLEVLSRLKASAPQLHSIVISGYATEHDTMRALRLGAGDYLKKPFSLSDLLETVSRVDNVLQESLQERKAEEQLRQLTIWSLRVGTKLDPTGRSDKIASSLLSKIEQEAGKRGCSKLQIQHFKCSLLYLLLKEIPEEESWSQLDVLADLLPPSVLVESEAIKNHKDKADHSILAWIAASFRQCEGSQIIPESDSEWEGQALETATHSEQRSLLSLGQSLLASGQHQAAEEAFRRTARGLKTEEHGRALLALSQLSWSKESPAKVESYLDDASRLKNCLGPQGAAELSLELAVARLKFGQEERGRAELEACLPLLRRLGLSNKEGLAKLLLFLTSSLEPETSLPELLDFDFSSVEHRDWLLLRISRYLEICSNKEPIERALVKWSRASPKPLARLLLASANKQFVGRMLKLFQEAPDSVPVELCEALSSKTQWPVVQKQAQDLLQLSLKPQQTRIQLYSLGRLEIWLGALPVPEQRWKKSLTAVLFACLASRRGKPILLETLLEQFWPGAGPKLSRKRFSQLLTDLRQVTREYGLPSTLEPVIRHHDTVMLNPELVLWHDLERLEDLQIEIKATVASGEPVRSYQLLREASSLARGPYLEHISMEWVRIKRSKIERLREQLFSQLAESCFHQKLFPESCEVCERALAINPFNQRVSMFYMSSLSRSGHSSGACEYFEALQKRLQRELGIEPATELVKAYHLAKACS